VSRNVRVLVVDDSDFFGMLVASELSELYEMDLESVTSASEALDRLEAEPFDCVVSDYDMPETNGIELFERLHERGIDLPFFLLTAAGSEEVASEAITAGITDYFPKTRGEEQFEVLGKRIENVVAQRRAERDLQRQRRLHEEFWEVTQDLMHAPTRTDIDAAVCEHLADADRFLFAWVSDGPADGDPRARAGIDTATFERFRAELDERADGGDPIAAALADQTVQSVTGPTSVVDDVETLSVVAVPLLYRDSTYGVLALATTAADALGETEREDAEQLGVTVGHALAAVETEREVETFQAAVEQADPAIVITDTDGTIEYVNRAFEEITGYGTTEATGSSFEAVVTAEWDEDRWAALRERVRAGEPVREEIVQHRKDGAQFHADLSVAPITVGTGHVRKFVAIESDITELKSREQRLQVLNRVLRHNLRNDLNVVQGHLSVLLDGLDGPDRPDGLDGETADHARKGKRKIEQLIALSEKVRSVDRTVRAAGDTEARDPTDLRELVAAEVERARKCYPDATVGFDVPEGLAIRATQLDVAIRELVANAIEHNDAADPRVEVRATDDTADFIAVEIVDNGPGIPEIEREVLADGQETELKHGRSLGLWLVNWVVTYAGGELTIGDAPGGGSVVGLTVPLASG